MLAAFSELQNTSTDQLILVFGASDSIPDVQKKLDLFKLKCPTFIPDDETQLGEVFKLYRVSAYPTIVVVDERGTIKSHQVGPFIH